MVERLATALTGPLPGPEAHSRMAPSPRRGWRPGEVPVDSRAAACLLLVYPRRAVPHFVLTLRPRSLARHGGQVSMPGGAVEPAESVEHAALREAREEIGADPGSIRILGALTPLHVPVSGFVMHPVLGVSGLAPEFRAADGEVEAVLEVPLADLLDSARIKVERRVLAGSDHQVPFFSLAGEKVWGATAMILAEVAWLLGRPPSAGS